GLQALPGLRRNRSDAPEPEPIKPVAEEYVLRTCEYLSPVVAAMVRVQLYTGMRSGELVQLRPIDVDTTGKVWQYRPPHHKTAYRGHTRVVPIGPRAQKALAPFMTNRAVDQYCFSPAEAEAWRRAEQHRRRKTPLNQGNRPGTNRLKNPSKKPGDRYDATSYRKAVEKAIRKANREIEDAVRREMAGAKDKDIKAEIDRRRLPHWTPHRLRHTAATRIRRDFGLDAARAVLGQRTLAIADRYAEIDQPIAEKAASKLG
ncbi:MAG: tyrosine-type recombinase/integrase, partial [Phycisphaerae bacterium]